MNERIFYSEYFYQKGSKEIDVLEKNAKEYPYSSLATFMLLYHYKKIAHPGFEKLAKKTALLFNNQHWLQFQLNNKFSINTTKEISTENFQAEEETTHQIKDEQTTEIYSEQNLIEDTDEVNRGISEIIEQQNEIIGDTFIPAENIQTQNEIKENVLNNSVEKEQPLTNEIEKNKDELIAFEPLHTVDYFASQGIKINEELLTNDKLGSQMKSFTAWLKSMKKLHPVKLEEQGLANEKLIQTAADESNINTEVLTEAMAEVLIKQDKKEKAIEMFSKLSLINPSKSAYFAAKIESIKSN